MVSSSSISSIYSISSIIIFLIGLSFLSWFTWADIKKREVDNFPIVMFLVVGIVIAIFRKEFPATIICIVLSFLLGYFLWNRKALGAADSKILAVLPAYFAGVGFPNLIVKMWVFTIILLIVGVVYAFVFKMIMKKKMNEKMNEKMKEHAKLKTHAELKKDKKDKKDKKNKKYELPPFLPVITVCYILLWLINIK